MPAAQKIDDSRGTSSAPTSSSRAIAAACSGPGAAGDHEREVARVEAAAHAHVAHAGRHRHVDEVVDARRGLLDAEPQRRGERLERAHGGLAVEPHPAVRERSSPR